MPSGLFTSMGKATCVPMNAVSKNANARLSAILLGTIDILQLDEREFR